MAAFQCSVNYNVVPSCGMECAGRGREGITIQFSMCFSALQLSVLLNICLVILNLTSESVSFGTIKRMVLILETS